MRITPQIIPPSNSHAASQGTESFMSQRGGRPLITQKSDPFGQGGDVDLQYAQRQQQFAPQQTPLSNTNRPVYSAQPVTWNPTSGYAAGQTVHKWDSVAYEWGTYRALTNVPPATPDFNPAFKRVVIDPGASPATTQGDMDNPQSRTVRMNWPNNPQFWNGTNDYNRGDVVAYNSQTYVATRDNASSDPRISPNFVNVNDPWQGQRSETPSTFTRPDGTTATLPIRERAMEALDRTRSNLETALQALNPPAGQPLSPLAQETMKRFFPYGGASPRNIEVLSYKLGLELNDVNEAISKGGNVFSYYYTPNYNGGKGALRPGKPENMFFEVNTYFARNSSNNDFDRLFMHEFSHKTANTEDHFYLNENGGREPVPPSSRGAPPDPYTGTYEMNNADSIALAALTLAGYHPIRGY
jgi:hypothetical protein